MLSKTYVNNEAAYWYRHRHLTQLSSVV